MATLQKKGRLRAFAFHAPVRTCREVGLRYEDRRGRGPKELLLAAERALALDPKEGAAHFVLAFIAQYHEQDFGAAIAHIERLGVEEVVPDLWHLE